MNNNIRRGTTPVLRMKLKGIEVTDISKCYVTIKQNDYVLTKKATYVDEAFQANLTQEETLKFTSNSVKVQMKIKTTAGDVVATDIAILYMKDILNEEIL